MSPNHKRGAAAKVRTMHEIMDVTAVTESRAARLGRALCLGGALLGAVALIGWLAGVDGLIAFVPGLRTDHAERSHGAHAARRRCGVATRHHRDARRECLVFLAAAVALAIGLVTFAEHAFDLPFSIDRLLVRTEVAEFSHAGRLSPLTALALALLAAAIILFDRPSAARAHVPECLTLCTALIAFTALLAQLFGGGPIYRIPT